ncbi:MAG TPA: VOC family protein [Gemmatirosa sp.]|nr:VOC family protein [Gemmatirosa sp.]
MTDPRTQPAGTLAGFDLTVPDAAPLRDFYASVVGWAPMEVDMGSYADFVMTAPATGAWVAGLCHARGGNADLPPQWLAYVLVDDLEASRARCVAGGGTLLTEVKGAGSAPRYCVIRDPAGAVLALMQRVAG